MTETVLVTGAAGFIGSHLCERLIALGYRVIGLDNFSDFYAREIKEAYLSENLLNAESFQFLEEDVCNRSAVLEIIRKHRPDSIIHLAAMAGVRPSIENPALYAEVNISGTINILDAAVEQKVNRLVFASSSSVYGNNEKVPFAEEDRVDHPISPYAATKKAGELICHAYSHLHQLPIACLRFFTVYGPRQRPDLAISKFFRLIEQGKPIELFGDGTTSRDYTYIDDIINGICAAFERNNKFRIYNLGGNEPVSLKNLISGIEKTMGREADIILKTMQPGDVNHTFADLTRSGEELNYRPKTNFLEGLKKQWRWYQDHRALN